MNAWKHILALGTACSKLYLEVMPEKVANKALGAGTLGIATLGAFPAALIAAGVGEVALKHIENRPHPGALAKEFRSSLLHALRKCQPDSKGIFAATESDLALWRLWEQGFESHGDSDPGWTAQRTSLPQECRVDVRPVDEGVAVDAGLTFRRSRIKSMHRRRRNRTVALVA